MAMSLLLTSIPLCIATASARQYGQWTGSLLVFLLLLVGVVKCREISLRPTTNTKCALALMFFLLGWLSGSLAGVQAPWLPAGPIAALVAILVGLAVVSLLVTAVVLAILGLIEVRHRPGDYVQGRSQAVWTLVLAGAVLAYGVGSAVLRGVRGPRLATGVGQSGQVSLYDDLNFRFRAPARPWVPFDAGKLNHWAKLGFLRRFPEVYFLVIPERTGDVETSSEQLSHFGQAQMQSLSSDARVVRESPWTINGATGLRVEREVTIQGRKFYYLCWYFATNGFSYQLIGYGLADDRQLICSETEQVLAGFELVDPHRVGLLDEQVFAQDFESPRHAYRVKVARSPWARSPTLGREFPEAEFVAERGAACMAVVPVALVEEDPGLEAVTAGLLATMAIGYPSEPLTNPRRLKLEGVEGVQYDFRRVVAGTEYAYDLRVLRGNGFAYLLAAWAEPTQTNIAKLLDDALGRVEFIDRLRLFSAPPAYTERERQTQGLVLNQAGLFHFRERRHERAVRLFCAAVRADGTQTVYLKNALVAWAELERPAEALAFVDARPATAAHPPELRAMHARLQAAAGQKEAALTNYAQLYASGYRDEDHFTGYVHLLLSEQNLDRAGKEVATYLQGNDSTTIRRLEAQIYRQKKDLPKALALLEAQLQKQPNDVSTILALAEMQIDAGLCSDSLAVCRGLIANGNDSPSVWWLRGQSEYGLKWYREAKVSFETALKGAPANTDIRAFLDHVSALLGEGNNLLLKEAIPPVPLPAELVSSSAEPAPADYAKDYGAYYERRIQAVSFSPGREYKRTEHMIIRVLDRSGVAAFSTLQWEFDPIAEQVFVNEMRVSDASGRTLSTGDVADSYVLDAHRDEIASQVKTLNVPVRGLQPGCSVHVVLTRRDLSRPKEMPFLEYILSSSYPVREAILFWEGPTNGIQAIISPSMPAHQVAQGSYWSRKDPPVFRLEALQPAASEFLPTLWLNEAGAQWSRVAADYLTSIRSRLEPDPTVEKLARDLLQGTGDLEASVALLAHHVQTNLTYKAIEFGSRARIPNRVADVVRNQYGDCKDHALLLRYLLEAAGIRAHLALVRHGPGIRMDLPSLAQFDHMVVFVPELRRGWFIDATDKGSDLRQHVPALLAGKPALILDERNVRFETIPAHPPDAAVLRIQRQVRLSETGLAVVEDTMSLEGLQGSFWRNVLLPLSPGVQRDLLQRQLELDSDDLTDFVMEGLKDPTQPLTIRSRYTLRHGFRPVDGRLRGSLPAAFIRFVLPTGSLERRRTPFEIRVPLRCNAEIRVIAPAGYEAETPAGTAPEVDPKFGVASASLRCPESTTLTLGLEYRQTPGSFAPEDYSAYLRSMEQLAKFVEQPLSFRPKRE